MAKEVEDRVNSVANALRDAGAQLNEEARPAFDPSESHSIYGHLLQATMASRMPDADYNSLAEHVSLLIQPIKAMLPKPSVARVTSFRDWASANEERNKLRWAWHDYFGEFDALVMPIMATPAFKHDHRPFGERAIMVDNAERPYFEQVFLGWLDERRVLAVYRHPHRFEQRRTTHWHTNCWTRVWRPCHHWRRPRA